MRNTITPKTTPKKIKRMILLLWGLTLLLVPHASVGAGVELNIPEENQSLPVAMDIEQPPVNILAPHQQDLEVQRISRQGEALRFIDNTEDAWAQGKYPRSAGHSMC